MPLLGISVLGCELPGSQALAQRPETGLPYRRAWSEAGPPMQGRGQRQAHPHRGVVRGGPAPQEGGSEAGLEPGPVLLQADLFLCVSAPVPRTSLPPLDGGTFSKSSGADKQQRAGVVDIY